MTVEKIMMNSKNSKNIRSKQCPDTWSEKCFPGVQIIVLASATSKKVGRADRSIAMLQMVTEFQENIVTLI